MEEAACPSGPKVAIVGAGAVGATFAYALAMRGLVSEIALIDIDEKRARGEAMDISHGAAFMRPVAVVAGGYEVCSGADVVVITAGAAQREGESRRDLAVRNVDVFRSILPHIVRAAPRAILVVVTNPVDVMTYVAHALTGYPASRVIGSGTVLDSSRFRFLLSSHCGIDPRSVHAYILGEHGDSEVPAWSLTNIAGQALSQLCWVCGNQCNTNWREDLFAEVRDAAYRVIEAKGATYYAIGLALVEIVGSILRDERTVLPVSVLLDGQFGMRDVCLSVPAIVGREGVLRILEMALPDDELAALRGCGEVVRGVISGLGELSRSQRE